MVIAQGQVVAVYYLLRNDGAVFRALDDLLHKESFMLNLKTRIV